MRDSLDAAREQNVSLQAAVTQESHDVSTMLELLTSGVQDSLAAAHDKMDVLGHKVSVVAHEVSVAAEQTNPILLTASHRLIGPPVQPPEPRVRQPLPISPPLIVETRGNDTTLPDDHEDADYPPMVPDNMEAVTSSSGQEKKKKRKRRRSGLLVLRIPGRTLLR